jgi:hypothetical protein
LGELAQRAGPAGIDAEGINQILSPRPNPDRKKSAPSPIRGSRFFVSGTWAGIGTEYEVHKIAKQFWASPRSELVPQGLMPKASTKSSHPDQVQKEKGPHNLLGPFSIWAWEGIGTE